LWKQVSALPLRDQLELAGRIRAQVPSPPEDVLPSTWDEAREMLAHSEAEVRTDPRSVVPAREAVARMRSRHHL
jgi:hypothetical protein